MFKAVLKCGDESDCVDNEGNLCCSKHWETRSMNFIDVFSREQAIVLEPRPDTVVISISSPGNRATLRTGWKEILWMEFHDFVEPPTCQVLNDKMTSFEDAVLFNEEMANFLWGFIHTHKDKNFVVHCNAGVSRSVAVGMIISELFPDSHALKLHAVGDTRFANGLILRLMHKKMWDYCDEDAY